MSLKQLRQICDESNGEAFNFYGLDLDGEDVFTDGIFPRKGLETLSVKAYFTEGELSEELLDFINLVASEGRKLIVEVEVNDSFDRRELVSTASLLGFDIAIKPILNGCFNSMKDFIELGFDLFKISNEFFNFKGHIQPISGYVHYMVQRELGVIPSVITEDPYYQKFYVDLMTMDEMDHIKEEWDGMILDFFGGKEGFKTMVHSISVAQFDRLEAQAKAEIEYSNKIKANSFSPSFMQQRIAGELIRLDKDNVKQSNFLRRAERLALSSKRGPRFRCNMALRKRFDYRVIKSRDAIFNG